MITVILVNKNRDINRVNNCINSLKNQNCKIILVDFGSNEEILLLERLLPVNLIEVKNNTKIFNKCRALNIGLKQAKTKYVLFSDIDCIFSNNFINETIKALQKNKKIIVLSQKIDLDKTNKETNLHEPSASGSCIAIKTNWAKKVHGFDEIYTFWGREDNDFVNRAMQDGFEDIWITNKIKLWHQWHELPDTRSLNRNIIYYEKLNKPIIRNSNNWGQL